MEQTEAEEPALDEATQQKIRENYQRELKQQEKEEEELIIYPNPVLVQLSNKRKAKALSQKSVSTEPVEYNDNGGNFYLNEMAKYKSMKVESGGSNNRPLVKWTRVVLLVENTSMRMLRETIIQ